jgi:ParB-like nuclease domain
MGDLAIACRPLGELIPYVRNPRTHSDAQVAQIAASIREFGWTSPVLVDGENGIIAEHSRVLAARKLGLECVPVIELVHMSEAQKRLRAGGQPTGAERGLGRGAVAPLLVHTGAPDRDLGRTGREGLARARIEGVRSATAG